LDCAACTVGPLSQLTLQLPSTCQSLHILGFAIGSRGTFSAVSLVASGNQLPALNDSQQATIASVSAAFEPMLEVSQNAPQAGAELVRGYTLAVGAVAVATVPSNIANDQV
jgi:hypothetical protein